MFYITATRLVLALAVQGSEPINIAWGPCWTILAIVVIALAIFVALLDSGPDRPT